MNQSNKHLVLVTYLHSHHHYFKMNKRVPQLAQFYMYLNSLLIIYSHILITAVHDCLNCHNNKMTTPLDIIIMYESICYTCTSGLKIIASGLLMIASVDESPAQRKYENGELKESELVYTIRVLTIKVYIQWECCKRSRNTCCIL